MIAVRSRAGLRPRGRWFAAVAFAANLALLPGAAHAAPNISGISPNQGELGSYVTIYGTGFGSTMGASQVLLADRPLPVLAWSDVAISVYLMPQNANTLERNVAQDLVVVQVQPPATSTSNAVPFTVTGPASTTPGTPSGTTTGTTGGTTGGTGTTGSTGTDTGTTGSTTGSTTGTTALAASDIRLLNLSLLLHRLSARFYNDNAEKPYLTGVTATDPGTGTTGGTTAGTTTGTTAGTTTGTTAGTTTGTTNSGTTTGTTTGTTADTTTGTTTGTTNGGTTTGTTGGTTTGGTTAGSTNGTTGGTTTGTTAGTTTGTTGTTNGTTAGTTTGTTGGTTAGTTTGSTTGGTTNGTTAGTTTGTTGTGTTTGTDGTVGGSQDTGTTAGSNLAALRSLVQEIRAHHNAHVAMLEQTLGTNAQPVPTFQNLDAPTLQQFLTMAQTMEDLGASAHTGLIPLVQDKSILAMIAGIGIVEGRHAGAIRTYRKIASTAEGGDPNLTLTEDGSAVQVARTPQQVLDAVAGFVTGGITDTSVFLPGTTGTGSTDDGTGTGGNGTTGGTTGGGSGSGTGTGGGSGTGSG